MSRRERDGSYKRERGDARVQTDGHENGRAESWQAGPSTGAVSNATYDSHGFKLTDDGRTGLRSTDAHASWREVYAACHVGVGVDE